MQLSHATALFLMHTGIIAFALQIGRGINQSAGPVSSASSPMSRHAGYVDQKVRRNPYAVLNHESWHQRNVVSGPLNDTSTLSNITSDVIVAEEGSTLPDSAASDDSKNASSSSSDIRLTDIPELLQSTTASKKSDMTDEEWNNQTNEACVTALSVLKGASSNPAGVAVCYNVRTFNGDTGSFKADLRLYQIGPPAKEWSLLESASEALDVSYAAAQLVKSGSIHKRDKSENRLNHDQGEEGSRSLSTKRSNGPPKMLQGLTLLGVVQGDFSADSMNQSMIRSFLVPNITFSGSTSDGIPVSTQLSTKEAFYVNGLFTHLNAASNQPESTRNATDFEFHGNSLAAFPVGLIVTSVWALLLSMIMGYSTMSKVHARAAYRRRVRSRLSGDSRTNPKS